MNTNTCSLHEVQKMCAGTRKSLWFWFYLSYLDEKVVQGFPTNEWKACVFIDNCIDWAYCA